MYLVHKNYVLKNNEDGPSEMWMPFYDEVTKTTIEASKTNKRVVLTCNCLRNAFEEYAMEKLKEGVDPNEVDVQMLRLSIDEDVRLTGLYYRSLAMAEDGGMSITDWLRKCFQYNGPEGEEMSLEEYIKFEKEGSGALGKFKGQDPLPYAKVVDVSNRDVTAINNIEEALGLLPLSTKELYVEYNPKVAAIDKARNAEMMKNIDKSIK